MLAHDRENISDIKSYIKNVDIDIGIYNDNRVHTEINLTPSDALRLREPIKDGWKFQNDNYRPKSSDVSEIRKNLEEMKRLHPLHSLVRKKFFNDEREKRTHTAKWSREIFRVRGYRVGRSPIEPVTVRLSNLSGKEINGIYYGNQIKQVNKSEDLIILKFLSFNKKTRMVRFTLRDYPVNYIIKQNIDDIEREYIVPRTLLKEYQNYKNE